MRDKASVIAAVQQAVTEYAQAQSKLSDAVKVYFTLGYQSGGSDPIVDADCVPYKCVASDVGDGVFLGQQLAVMLANGQPTQSNYQLTLDRLRNDL